jgi:photosystem II stability/assembly factor-like uncharacterized protein
VNRASGSWIALLFALACVTPAFSDSASRVDPRLYADLHYRMIGPFRGGRTVAAAGIPSRPNVFYVAANNGGVWTTNDYGRTWKPIFDDQPTGSIGALAIAPANPDIIYVGSGEGIQRPDLSIGNGMYKSLDGGKSWKHLGLRDGQQIGAIIVDPHDANRLFVAVLGHPYGPNAERGVFRSTDGGETFQKVLYKNENTGAIALAFDPHDSKTVYADLFASRQGPWENGFWFGDDSGLMKSVDGGTTWKPLTRGLPGPKDHLGRIGFAIAPSNPSRLYATIDVPKLGGIYRSDDAGESWQRVNDELRLYGRGFDFAEICVHPKDPDTVFIANTSTYRSTDGGRTWHAIKGAPGGDDYHTIWINPVEPQIMLLACDQGAIVTVNGGETWSTWYNQPTAQFYHVITDNQFPYWVYGGQQESGSAAVASRGGYGQILAWDWHPVGVEEYGYVAPDPLNPNLIYGGKATRYDRRTGQTQFVGPEAVRTGDLRFLRTAPLLFSPVDPHVLYLGANVLQKTANGGQTWERISPDLTREHPDVPQSIGVFRKPQMAKMPRRGVIYTVAPSYRDAKVIWAGTDDGLIHITRDGGKSWQNVTPAGITSWSKISLIDAGRFDAGTAYAAVNRFRLDDQRPHIYRTHDYGRTWQEIVRGLPDAPINAVREDPIRKGLLFCGSELCVSISFNDGDDWQALRLNMPATSIRDLVIHGDDLVIGTHGRSFWILDDISVLRQLDSSLAGSDMHLFRPQTALRVRWNVNTDTPFPPEEPAGKNPPDGAILDYWLREDADGPLTIEILDSAGNLVRRYSSQDGTEGVEEKSLDVPMYWIRPSTILGNRAGHHRLVWDLHYPAPSASERVYPISAVYRDTAAVPAGPWAACGQYAVRLTCRGHELKQPLSVRMDPRVTTPESVLLANSAMARKCWRGMNEVNGMLTELKAVRDQVPALAKEAGKRPIAGDIASFDEKAKKLAGTPVPWFIFYFLGGPGNRESSLNRLYGELGRILHVIDDADAELTHTVVDTAGELEKKFADLHLQWDRLLNTDLAALNKKLAEAKLQTIRRK